MQCPGVLQCRRWFLLDIMGCKNWLLPCCQGQRSCNLCSAFCVCVCVWWLYLVDSMGVDEASCMTRWGPRGVAYSYILVKYLVRILLDCYSFIFLVSVINVFKNADQLIIHLQLHDCVVATEVSFFKKGNHTLAFDNRLINKYLHFVVKLKFE